MADKRRQAIDQERAQLLERKAQAGRKSGEARRARTKDRDDAIRAAATAGASQRQLVARFSLARSTIRNILNR